MTGRSPRGTRRCGVLTGRLVAVLFGIGMLSCSRLTWVCGKPHLASGSHGYNSPPAGTHCVFGKGGYSQVQNNEWIVFDAKQNELRYLAEFSA